MNRILIALSASALLLAGCGNKNEEEVASLKAQVSTLGTSLKQTSERAETLQDQVTELDGKLRDATGEADDLRVKLERAQNSGDDEEIARLKKRITGLEEEIEQLKAAAVAEPVKPAVEPETPDTDPMPEPPSDPEVKRKLTELLPLVKGETNTESLDKLQALLNQTDKATRDDYIAKIHKWVEDEPENKRARMALASVLTTRFQDLKEPLKQGALAGQIKKETEKALEIDPEYYEAQHFLAILKVNYPTFMPEFTGADKDLDKALELQSNMTWEDRFADIYSAYSMWYRKQSKLDEAAGKVQAGLDHAPRNQGLLNEQQAIENARAAATEE